MCLPSVWPTLNRCGGSLGIWVQTVARKGRAPVSPCRRIVANRPQTGSHQDNNFGISFTDTPVDECKNWKSQTGARTHRNSSLQNYRSRSKLMNPKVALSINVGCMKLIHDSYEEKTFVIVLRPEGCRRVRFERGWKRFSRKAIGARQKR